MTDEKLEKVREKLANALDREHTLRLAVEWYADDKNWGNKSLRSPATIDRGNRAKAALKNA